MAIGYVITIIVNDSPILRSYFNMACHVFIFGSVNYKNCVFHGRVWGLAGT